MGKLSQKELIEEGISTMLDMAKKAVQVGAQGVGQVGKALMPNTAKAVGAVGSAVGTTYNKIAGTNPKMVLRNYLDSARGRRRFNKIKLGRERRLASNHAEVSFKGEVFDDRNGVMIPMQGFFILSPTDDKEEKWEIIGAQNSEYQTVWNGKRRRGRGSDRPTATEPQYNDFLVDPEIQLSSYSQKNLLRQLTLLSN
tara:strand:+ start:488 stop:1078 length:591 start_codon:yes stop_codon:yes gene_type:complete